MSTGDTALPDPAALDNWLAAREANQTPPLRAGVAKRVVWAESPGHVTPVSVVYIHGFSATSEEIRPVPDRVAQALGANLYFARLTGHGQDGAAMGRAQLSDWIADAAEAFAIGNAIGQKTLVMACSTGCTVAALAVAQGAKAQMLHFTSPNFGMAFAPLRWLLRQPGLHSWGPLLVGRERGFTPISEAHGAFWTTRYDTQAVFTMGDAVTALRKVNLGSFSIPCVTHLCPQDRVVSASITRRSMHKWGAETVIHSLPKGRDANGHLLAGDIFNPDHNDRVVKDVLDGWARFG